MRALSEAKHEAEEEGPHVGSGRGEGHGARETERTKGPTEVRAEAWMSLVNGTLSWYSEQGLAGVVLSPDLSYDERSHELVVAEAGVYFVFLRMQLWQVMRAGPPSQGEVSLTLQLQPPSTEATDLALTVTVPRICSSKDLGSKPAGGFWGHLVDLQGGQRLSVRLSALLQGGAEAHRAWQLAPHAVFGLFRVTGDVPGELFV
ncbi:PREDICTED: tumor necrosis factor ligand superfamily member 9 [Dipodomys ordii]|uniref:Tumor necrosis factor ligand superfamily member 9 n=1 Tax=Dipodomys ordii TaxID=10020 RepID=A0A1S3FQK4_DIPOR|nr:PREDICTED: tumor necrosis factor ligand superfamily member 9 [Dipodomys ordii]